MRYCSSFFLLLIVLLSGCSSILGGETAEVTLKVVDELGKTLEGANVAIGFLRNSSKGGVEKAITGSVNKDGTFTAKCRTNGLVGGNVKKDGYYDSSFDYPFNKKKNGKWIPWNPVVTVVMRKIQNPVPMYARRIEKLVIPVLNQSIGYDLTQTDWVRPYGNGKISDFMIKIESTYTNNLEFDGKLIIATNTKGDGFILFKEEQMYGSHFKLPRFAPNDGYEPVVIKTSARTIGKPVSTNITEDANYIFRVRSSQNDGSFGRALYGKIRGDFTFSFDAEKASLNFTYYLNPDYTRNLEFDPKRNLFTNVTRFEAVAQP